MTTTLTPPLKWHGGKHDLAKWIIGLMPPRCKKPNSPDPDDKGWLHYVEPYFGGGSVLLANDPEGVSEVANDLNGDLTNFWQVIANDGAFSHFERRITAVPFSQTEWGLAETAERISGPIGRAVAFFVRCRQSLAGRMDSFASITRNRTRRGMNEQVSAWLNCIEGLPAVHARLKRVLILNKPAPDVIRKEDGPRALFYADPPYCHSTRSTTKEYGPHEMTDEQHKELLACLSAIKGRFLLSGYRSELYDLASEKHGWRREDLNISNHAAGGKTKKIMTESVWMNY